MKKVLLFLILFAPLIANAETIVTDSTSDSTITSTIDSSTKLTSPPPSAISPQINVSNSDLCTVGVAGAVQTQILGISMGTVYTEPNCLLLKQSKQLKKRSLFLIFVSVIITSFLFGFFHCVLTFDFYLLLKSYIHHPYKIHLE